jgi:hypothetical protein
VTPSGVITELIPIIDGVDALDGDNTARRSRYLFWLQFINNYVHLYAPWEWTYTTATLTILGDPLAVGYNGGNKIALPTNFLETTNHGGLYDSTGQRWSEESVYILQRMRVEGLGADRSQCFSIFNSCVQIPFVTSSDISFTLIYRVRPEVLVDDLVAPIAEMMIPDRYKDTVIIPGVVHKVKEAENDARTQLWAGYFTDGLRQMAAREQPKQTRFKQWPKAVQGKVW